jgi:O-acetyl-ADP-ribose deacetylase (regulator of RNase III)
MDRIDLVQGDITSLAVDAIVNAANSALCGGGGVDGAIHRAAGPELLAVCRTLGMCPAGQAKISDGFALRARYVIHAVGPVWYGGGTNEPEALASCYRVSLELAAEHGCASVAFPAISCGAYGYPMDRAACLAIHTVRGWLATHRKPERVILCCFDASTLGQYQRAMDELA